MAIQRRLRAHLVLHDDLPAISTVAGVDIAFEGGRSFKDGGRRTRAAVAVLDAKTLAPVEDALAIRDTDFPYVPGLLSFGEIPAALLALAQLARRPDLILCDGHGFAHPRRMGLACHLGLATGIPCIGVAKSRLCGEFGRLSVVKGARVPLTDQGETIGAVLRSRRGVRPLFVSCGHRVSLETALTWTQRCVTRYRLPETTRRADALAGGRLVPGAPPLRR